MKHIASIIFLLGLLLGAVVPARAVTDKEMEEARTIAAQAYLRYANDGSGYLDDVRPTTMSALTKVLKEKEKENLKSFQAVAVPKDYASWDKAKLVEYWSETFFKSPGLIEKGKIGKSRVKTRVSRMTVAAPPAVKPAATAAADPNTAVKKQAEDASAAPGNVKSKTDTVSPAATPERNVAKESEAAMAAVADSIASIEEAEAELADVPVTHRKDSTWIYVLILCVLVAVVVALVIFASSTMKNQGRDDASPEERNRKLAEADEVKAAARAAAAEQEARHAADRDKMNAEREELLAELSVKDDRIASLTSRCESLAAECESLRLRVGALQDTIESMEEKRSGSATATEAPAAAAPVSAPVTASHVSATAAASASPVSVQATASASHAPAAAGGAVPNKIYLGRVNARGVFVRADRSLNIEGSVYVLETEDGYSGSFRVVRNRKVWERLLSNPGHWLEGGCTAKDGFGSKGDAVITESVGTAIFEDSCWRVIRKARVRIAKK